MIHAYAGKVLRVNLSDGRTNETSIDPELARSYMGGRGLATKFFSAMGVLLTWSQESSPQLTIDPFAVMSAKL